MTTTAEKIAVMQAFERGEAVDLRVFGGGAWVRTDVPIWNWHSCEYRVAPKPIDLVEVLRACHSRMSSFDVRPADKQEVLGHAWTDIIARAKELQG